MDVIEFRIDPILFRTGKTRYLRVLGAGVTEERE